MIFFLITGVNRKGFSQSQKKQFPNKRRPKSKKTTTSALNNSGGQKPPRRRRPNKNGQGEREMPLSL